MLESRKQISRYISQGLDAKDDIVSWNKEKSTEIKIRRYHQILKYKLVRKSIFANIREQGDRIVFIGIIALTIIIGKNKGYEETRIIALYLYINLLYGSVIKINTVLQDCLEVNVKFEGNYLFMEFDEELTRETYGDYIFETQGVADNLVVELDWSSEDDDKMFEELKPMFIEEAKKLEMENVILVFDWDNSEVAI